MTVVTSYARTASPDLVTRRLAGGLLLSIVIHALVLSLQFGMPGLGLPLPAAPISVRIVQAEAPPQAEPAAPEPVPAPPPRPEMGGGLTLLENIAPPRPVPKKPSQTKRISRPSALPAPQSEPTRVIAQDQNPNQDFVVPLPQPEEALQKTIDPKEAQHGTDDATEASTALEAVTQMQAPEAEQVAEEKRRDEALLQAARERQAEQAEQAERQRAAALAVLEQQAAQQQALREEALRIETALALEARTLAQEQTQQLAARQKAEQLAARQQAELAAQREAELAAQREAEQAAQRQAEQTRAAERAAARAQAAASAAAGPAGRPEGSGTQVLVPKNLFSSDLVNRAREASRGLDILSGTPPRPREQDQSRRRIVVGAIERDVPLRMYVDSWRQKIERNGGLNYSQLSKERVRIDPLVSVAIRSDGSVEEVILIRSTGRAEMDEAVRRIVRVNARYSAFPPNIAAQYDVIEIRRIWNFDETLKLLEEMR